MQKLLISTLAIGLFAFVVYALLHANVKENSGDYRIQTSSAVKEVQAAFEGQKYGCDDGSNLYVNELADGAYMTLEYPDGLYATAQFTDAPVVSGDTSVYTSEENVLTTTETTADFAINSVKLIENCTI